MVLEKLCSLVRIPARSRWSSSDIRLFLLLAIPCRGLGFQRFGCSSSSVIYCYSVGIVCSKTPGLFQKAQNQVLMGSWHQIAYNTSSIFFAKMIKCSSWNSGFSDIGSMQCCNPGNRSGGRSGADPCVQAGCAASEIGQLHALPIEVTHVATWNAKYLDNVAASWGWPDLESQPVPLCDLAAYEFAIHWSLRDHFVDSGCQAFLLFSNSAMFDTNNSSRNSSHLPDESWGHPRRLYVGTTKSCVILRNLKGLEYFMMLDICPFLESEVCTIFVL